ncbi:hypothetical protein GCM10007989_27620 [Devosia pacifica]|uniref:N-acetyltransferase domain-containing protein n=1 Tax=Devosia pacifica TaxID=1335967 RepID=A0A918VUK8_9HYPH|nr:GNAT family N-acetyltransferase [Devosia pacifica]GHA30352.1 hypothetical protein GCM10007989_27620 [Devosia pacifica]
MRSDPNLLRRASDRDKPLVARLIQLYLYDLAAVVDFPIGADGLYDYEFLEAFWHTPFGADGLYDYEFLEAFWHTPYLLQRDGELRGFALVKRGCPLTDEEDCWFMAEFFVMRPYRRTGFGSRAVKEIFEAHPGRWHVPVLMENAPALNFWQKALEPFSAVSEPVAYDGADWRLFRMTG